MIRTMAGAALLVLALPVLATAQEPTPEVEAGRALFQGRGSCFTCHGREGGGTPLGPDLTDEAWV
ncbi:MAG TPA: c-type cytochrome, partial [Longimicrobiales bacterium]|nr:c-type cytochrome [Longimicrobiales bacterium]